MIIWKKKKKVRTNGKKMDAGVVLQSSAGCSLLKVVKQAFDTIGIKGNGVKSLATRFGSNASKANRDGNGPIWNDRSVTTVFSGKQSQ
jgi:hypothetical protein